MKKQEQAEEKTRKKENLFSLILKFFFLLFENFLPAIFFLPLQDTMAMKSHRQKEEE